MERAKDFGELRAGRIPEPFRTRRPHLAALILRLVAASPHARPLCTEVLRLIRPAPTSPLNSPNQSPVLSSAEAPALVSPLSSPLLGSAANAQPPPLAPPLSVRAEMGAEMGADVVMAAAAERRRGGAAGAHVVDPADVAESSGGSADSVDVAVHEGAMADMAVHGGASVDWRDAELTRRLLEMQLLAVELQLAEEGEGRAPP